MKVKFIIKEKLYAMCQFEIECDSEEEVEQALDEIGENVSADYLEWKLMEKFGTKNVKADGVNGIDNIEPADECEFWGWE